MTVLEVIQRSSEFLAQKGVESPRLQTELLLAHLLKMPRLKLYLDFQRQLADTELAALRELVKRRAARIPLQHIVGSTSFCGVELRCSPAALVPRPETELLAERGWQFLRSLPSESPRALDIGTGTGCLAISIAREAPSAQVLAVDISPDALELARVNLLHAGAALSERIELRLGNAFEVVPQSAAFDLVISNPPYIPSAEIAALEPEVRDHDPRIALDGGSDGLDLYRALASRGRCWLKPAGRMMLEFGDGQGPSLRNLFQNENWIVEELLDDYSARPRILIARLP